MMLEIGYMPHVIEAALSETFVMGGGDEANIVATSRLGE
jgi:hypothetical protein